MVLQMSIPKNELKWGHAVNSIDHLNKCLNSNIHMIEADISVTTTQIPQIIMSHDPKASGDSFKEWLDIILTHNVKLIDNNQNTIGIKLDFKSPDIVSDCISILNNLIDPISSTYRSKLQIWLNADILGTFLNIL